MQNRNFRVLRGIAFTVGIVLFSQCSGGHTDGQDPTPTPAATKRSKPRLQMNGGAQ